VGQAARERSLTLSVDVPFLELLRSEAKDHSHVHHWFELLLNRGFVREVDEGQYLIAPGLWPWPTTSTDASRTGARRTDAHGHRTADLQVRS
jgi:hypothetical protein